LVPWTQGACGLFCLDKQSNIDFYSRSETRVDELFELLLQAGSRVIHAFRNATFHQKESRNFSLILCLP